MELSGQFTDKPTSSQSSPRNCRTGHLVDWITCGLDDSWTSHLAKWFDVKFTSLCDIYKFPVGEMTSFESSSTRVDESAT